MQTRRFATATLALFLVPLIYTAPASADNRPPAPDNQNYADLNAAYKIAFDKFREDLKVYENNRRLINQKFKEAIEKAMSDARNSNLSAQTQMQKRQNMSVKQGVVISATAARDAAIEALGAAPVAPAPPAKPMKTEKVRK